MNFKTMKLYKWGLQATNLITTHPIWILIISTRMMATNHLKVIILKVKIKSILALNIISNK